MLDQATYLFMKYVSAHGKNYDTVEEFNRRLAIFLDTHAFIEERNATNSSYRAGFNQFSDWSHEEKDKLLGLKGIEATVSDDLFVGAANASSKDWRDSANVVTPVKNQGACGSCWAFSATEAVESAYVIAGNEQVIMAPQELVDCSRGLLSNHGCNGGMYYHAWDWLKTHMSMRETDYPYTSGTTGDETECAYDESKGVTNVSGYQQASPETESIKAAIEIGPCSVAVAAGNDVFMNYSSGIVTADEGCPTKIDHAILAVGYGYEGDQGYYIVRNSWDTTWGESGYIRIGMGEGDGVCGINQVVYYPII
jgi:C1A family cysteine protease